MQNELAKNIQFVSFHLFECTVNYKIDGEVFLIRGELTVIVNLLDRHLWEETILWYALVLIFFLVNTVGTSWQRAVLQVAHVSDSKRTPFIVNTIITASQTSIQFTNVIHSFENLQDLAVEYWCPVCSGSFTIKHRELAKLVWGTYNRLVNKATCSRHPFNNYLARSLVWQLPDYKCIRGCIISKFAYNIYMLKHYVGTWFGMFKTRVSSPNYNVPGSFNQY